MVNLFKIVKHYAQYIKLLLSLTHFFGTWFSIVRQYGKYSEEGL